MAGRSHACRNPSTAGAGQPRSGHIAAHEAILFAPATYAQQHERGTCIRRRAYDCAVVILRMDGELDRARMADAIQALVAHHEVLRTALVMREGRVLQAIYAQAQCSVDLLEICTGARALDRAIKRLRSAPFDLERPPLVRAAVISVARSQHLVCLAVPHIVQDSWSVGVLADHLVRYYEATQPPAPDHLQAADFASWQHELVQASDLDRWRDVLEGASGKLHLPLDRNAVGRRLAPEYVTLPRVGCTVMAEVAVRARSAHTTVAVALAASFAAALWCLVDRQDDVVFGFQVANRDHPELAEVVGQLFDVVPVRVRTEPHTTLTALLQATAENLHYAYRSPVPGRQLLELLGGRYDASINVRPAPAPLPAPAGLKVRQIVSFENVTYYPARDLWWGAQLSLSADLSHDGGLAGDVCFNSAATGQRAAVDLALAFKRAVQCLALSPGLELQRLAALLSA